jgi:hypothetical protein
MNDCKFIPVEEAVSHFQWFFSRPTQDNVKWMKSIEVTNVALATPIGSDTNT